eukprot:m.22047 g.22047  ORF g.22047 m.22047 type:complete len:278 (+) comp28272_c0_seq2:136-969(+)
MLSISTARGFLSMDPPKSSGERLWTSLDASQEATCQRERLKSRNRATSWAHSLKKGSKDGQEPSVALLLNDKPVSARRSPQSSYDFARNSLHSPPPGNDRVSTAGADLSPPIQARKRSASLNLLSVPPIERPCHTPPPSPWFKVPVKDAADLMHWLPDTVPFEPRKSKSLALSPPDLRPVIVRSPSLARRASRDGLGLSSLDAETSKAMRRTASHRSVLIEEDDGDFGLLVVGARRRASSTSQLDCRLVFDEVEAKKTMETFSAASRKTKAKTSTGE